MALVSALRGPAGKRGLITAARDTGSVSSSLRSPPLASPPQRLPSPRRRIQEPTSKAELWKPKTDVEGHSPFLCCAMHETHIPSSVCSSWNDGKSFRGSHDHNNACYATTASRSCAMHMTRTIGNSCGKQLNLFFTAHIFPRMDRRRTLVNTLPYERYDFEKLF